MTLVARIRHRLGLLFGRHRVLYQRAFDGWHLACWQECSACDWHTEPQVIVGGRPRKRIGKGK